MIILCIRIIYICIVDNTRYVFRESSRRSFLRCGGKKKIKLLNDVSKTGMGGLVDKGPWTGGDPCFHSSPFCSYSVVFNNVRNNFL